MDPEQVMRNDDRVLVCRQCGFRYELSPSGLIAQTERGLCAVRAATAETPEARLSRRPQPDVWSVNAYVAHLADAAEVIAGRVRRIAEEERPFLPYHRQDEVATAENYDVKPARTSLQRLDGTVRDFLGYVRTLPEGAWCRAGVHAEAGDVSLSDIAHDMPHELLHHAGDLRRVGGTG